MTTGTFRSHPRGSGLLFWVGIGDRVRVESRCRGAGLEGFESCSNCCVVDEFCCDILGGWGIDTILQGFTGGARWPLGVGWYAGEDKCGRNARSARPKPGDGF